MAENVENAKAKAVATCRATDLLKAIIENKDMTLSNNRTLVDETGKIVKIRMQTCIEAQKICAMLTSSDPSNKKNSHLAKRVSEITEAIGSTTTSIRGRAAPAIGETKLFSVNSRLGILVVPVKLLFEPGTADFTGKCNVLFEKNSIIIKLSKPF